MNTNIEIILDNAGSITVQNTETKAVAFFADREAAKADLRAILADDDMSGWDLSEPEYFISDEDLRRHEGSGGYRLLSEAEIREMIG